MSKRFYSVQVGDSTDCSIGSTVKREAIKMANSLKRDHRYDGEEIRIVYCRVDDDFAEDVDIIREADTSCTIYGVDVGATVFDEFLRTVGRIDVHPHEWATSKRKFDWVLESGKFYP